MTLTITIDMDKKCKRCGKKGATQSGFCMKCISTGFKNGEFDHILKPLKTKERPPITQLEDDDICGLCGEQGANKFAHPIHWPGERRPETELVHDYCEAEECRRAHAALSDKQRHDFLRSIR